MALSLQSEPFGATGGIAGEGARRVLSRPRLGALELLVREALQNSWDARRKNARTILFAIDVWRLTRQQQRVLCDQVFAELPPKGLPLDSCLEAEIDVVVISDRGTVGLAGPTRSDQESEDEDEPTNFIEFFRNVGKLRSGVIGGGTYGFGKASLYAVSEASTIVAYSRVEGKRGRIESRLMAAALGQQYREKHRNVARRYTGRHWWGVWEDGVVEPLTGATADRLAGQLGFRTFEEGETGTSVMVLAPRVTNGDGNGRLRAAAQLMCRSALWYAWPLMLPDRPERHPRLVVEGTFEGERLPVPAVDDDPLLKEYAKAFRHALRATNSTPADPLSRLTMFPLECQRPIAALGRLALTRVFANLPAAPPQDDEEDTSLQAFSIPEGPPAHVALMRGPRLVVRYLRARVPPGVGVVGVFVADEDLNTVFAEAEPVTHDDWNSENLEERRHRTLVRVTRTRIEERVDEFARPYGVQDPAGDNRPLGGISRLLGSIIPGSPGTGAESQSGRTGSDGGGGGSGGRKATVRVEMLPDVNLGSVHGRTVARFPFRIRGGDPDKPVTLVARPAVLTADGGRESDTPVGADAPTVYEWACGDQKIADGEDRIRVTPEADATYALYVTVPENTAISAVAVIDEARMK